MHVAAADAPARADERRRQILDAAAAVFARSGHHRARTREIARVAGVAEGTLCDYFGTKRDLLIALIQRVTAESLPGTLAHIEEVEPRPWIRAVPRDRLSLFDCYRALLKAVPKIIADAAFQHEYVRPVARPFLLELIPVAGHLRYHAQLRPSDSRVVVPAALGAVVVAVAVNEEAFTAGGAASANGAYGPPAPREALVDKLVDLKLDGVSNHGHVDWRGVRPATTVALITPTP
jgi:AcrR family transcriptional regulator